MHTPTPPSAEFGQPPITTPKLLAAVLSGGFATQEALIELLGADATSKTLVDVEKALLSAGICAGEDLLLLKGQAAGRTTVGLTTRPLSFLPEAVVTAAGAIAVEGDQPTVAFVEDLPDNIAAVANHLGSTDFRIALTTIEGFGQLLRVGYRGAQAETREATKDVYEVLDEVIRKGASDAVLKVGDQPCLLVSGGLQRLNRRPLTVEWMEQQIISIAGQEGLEESRRTYGGDLAITYGDSARFRVNIGADRNGPTMVLRLLPRQIPTLARLQVPEAIAKFAHLERGLVIVTGPTGSGKSTTLAAILNEIITTQPRHVITLEDPIEYFFEPGRSAVSQRELGKSFTSFPEGLRQALRQAPDVILVGEMRDLETIRTAVTAAETGHLVFATLHTIDATQTLGRIISSFPEREQEHVRSQLVNILEGVVSQTLLERANSAGRVAAFEILLGTVGVRNNLRDPKGLVHLKNELDTGTKFGMRSMEESLAELVKAGQITMATAEYRARDKELFRRKLGAT